MDKALVHFYCGEGKGKTTAAIGLAVRASGAGLRVLFAQFLKGRPTAELISLKKLGIKILRCDEVQKFVPYMTEDELEQCKSLYKNLFDRIAGSVHDYDVVILDEIFFAVETGIIGLQTVSEFIKTRPKTAELVLTGRKYPSQLEDLADYISDIHSIKHPFDKGINARYGIEY